MLRAQNWGRRPVYVKAFGFATHLFTGTAWDPGQLQHALNFELVHIHINVGKHDPDGSAK